MYTRSYTDTRFSPPDGYDGTAIRISEPECETQQSRAECENQGDMPVHTQPRGFLSELFGGSLGNLFSGFSLKSIGIEEILIIIAALYLFFSKDGDKECGIMLFLLLFIS